MPGWLFRGNLRATDWVVRGAVALVFIGLGMEKVAGPGWAPLFERIGLGQWFRYFTGGVQIAGGVLLFVPAAARFGAALLAGTMLGAIVVHLFVLGSGFAGAIVPAVLLPLAVLAGWKGRGQADESALLTIQPPE